MEPVPARPPGPSFQAHGVRLGKLAQRSLPERGPRRWGGRGHEY